MDLDLLVIGDSSAGWQGAVTAAQLGHKVGLVALPSSSESDLRQIPSEVLAEARADWPLLRTVKQTALRLADPSVWCRFAGYVKATWQREIDLYQDQLLAAGGQVWVGSAALTGTDSVAVSGTTTVELQAPQMLIATGTVSQRPQFASRDLPNVCAAARLLDATALPREACIVGAGITGLRAACLLAWWGVKVQVIDGRSRESVLNDEETFDLRSQADELGVSFECGEDVIGLSEAGRRVVITLESGRRLETESVWLATGRHGRTDDLQLENAELSADDCGRLWCGAELRTWTESICAVGDVVGYSPEVGTEKELVRQAVEALLAPALV
ncbi:MAG: pyridine nucleotide-disulfide oxidoreductase dimerization region [Planctomycetaceae bacterium]|nr:pyridine nucleotide-disulfide oxidoreductase dimerization region [Planctomycetaceae bacterium]